MKIVAGLGNPGPRYAETLHNAGFHVVERLSRMAEIVDHGVDADAAYARARFHEPETSRSEEVLLLKPLTFMNRSGFAVAPRAAALGVAPEEILAVVDDLDLPPGRVRLRRSGSSGGHKGLISLENELATCSFPRLRVGIGSPPEGVRVEEYVLSRPASEALAALLEETMKKAAQAACVWILQGIERAMNEFNRREESADGKGERI